MDTKAAKVRVEESVHYSLTDPEAYDEWLWTAPVGDNHLRLGPQYRLFAVPFFHQQHCLRAIRQALDEPFDIHAAGHFHHCFNYLRQWMLCSADITLEPGNFIQRNFTRERIGATHTCRDWEPIYDFVGERWFDWAEYRDEYLSKSGAEVEKHHQW